MDVALDDAPSRRFCHLCGMGVALSSAFHHADFCYSCGATFKLPRMPGTSEAAVQTDGPSASPRRAPQGSPAASASGLKASPSIWKVPSSSPFFDANMERALQNLFAIVNSDRLYYSMSHALDDEDDVSGEGAKASPTPPEISVHKALEEVADAHEGSLRQVTLEHQNLTKSLERQVRAAIERAELAEGDSRLVRARLQAAEAEHKRVSALYEAQLLRLTQELERVAEQEKRHQQELIAAQAAEVRAAWNLLMSGLDKDTTVPGLSLR